MQVVPDSSRYTALEHDEQWSLLGPLHVSQVEAHALHRRVVVSSYWPREHTVTQAPVTVSPYRPAGHDAVQPPDDASANRGLVHTPAHTLVTGSANRPAGHAITQTLVTVLANTPNGHISMQLLPARTYGLTHAVQLSLPAPVHAPHCDAHGWHVCAAASS